MKRLAERVLSSRPILSRLAKPSVDGTLVLAYHNVVRSNGTEYGDASLHLPVDVFKEHCEVLASEATIVSLDALEEKFNGRPRVAITFDDAYSGAVENALPVLARYAWPATVFVAPGMLGSKAFWWDSVVVQGHRRLPAEVRERALRECGGRGVDVVRLAAELGFDISEPPAEARTATSEALERALAANPRLTLGAHTWSHVCLTAVEPDEAHREIALSIDWLKHFGARGIPQLAYPYGLTSKNVESLANSAGSRRSYLVEGGWFRSAVHEAHAIPRMNVPAGLSAAGLRLRLNGILSAK